MGQHTTSAAHGPEHESFLRRRAWTIATVVAIIMVGLALVGVGLATSVERSTAEQYWMALVPVYGLLCILTAWLRSGPNRPVDRNAVARQFFHWLGIALALLIDFILPSTGEVAKIAVGFNSLLILALGCYLAGVHLEILFVPVGLLLTVIYLVTLRAEQYSVMLAVCGAATVVAILVVRRLLARWHARNHPAAPVAGS